MLRLLIGFWEWMKMGIGGIDLTRKVEVLSILLFNPQGLLLIVDMQNFILHKGCS